jgi:hypothetical protein
MASEHIGPARRNGDPSRSQTENKRKLCRRNKKEEKIEANQIKPNQSS